mmetsp:Transcript_21488/g.73577  ORF Transcript_21488/g.73577 Transcript_21488/m.73577 type:complete len:107 (-) Transcript_21488:460-780(-)
MWSAATPQVALWRQQNDLTLRQGDGRLCRTCPRHVMVAPPPPSLGSFMSSAVQMTPDCLLRPPSATIPLSDVGKGCLHCQPRVMAVLVQWLREFFMFWVATMARES